MKRRTAYKVAVGFSSCGIAAGAEGVLRKFREAAKRLKRGVAVSTTGCLGMCHCEVIVEISAPDGSRHYYGDVTPERAERIAEEHLLGGRPVREWLIAGGRAGLDALPYFSKQKKIVLRNCGLIDPENIDDYIANGGYSALRGAVAKADPGAVIKSISASGLRGRGGGGFPTGRKWKTAREARGDKKYVVCNADEGDPGAFMDRSVLEGDPHSVIEGMAIAAFAVGAEEGFVYVRAEYPLAVKRLSLAVEQAERRGFLGKNIMGGGFDFLVSIKEGAGAFVCGEETALIKSLEGKRGMPKFRPPFPARSGLHGMPTCINNVETLANVPWIILNGPEAYSKIGTGGSKGAKVFALAGKIARGGLVEVPMGITIREIIEDIGGGSSSGLEVKAVQIGGPSGGCLPRALFDTPIDYESLQSSGAIMGSGGLIALDETSCMVDIARYFLRFTQDESCGKCTFCRVGTKRMLEILERICAGKGVMDDLQLLAELAQKIKTASLCGLGQTAPNPVLTTLQFFRDEYAAHIRDKRCPAKKCKALISFAIDESSCRGCGLCIRACPAGAIAGEKGRPHHIDKGRCVRCGLCVESCKLGAIAAE